MGSSVTKCDVLRCDCLGVRSCFASYTLYPSLTYFLYLNLRLVIGKKEKVIVTVLYVDRDGGWPKAMT